jgi:outer membrane lipoprotein-sorting protein
MKLRKIISITCMILLGASVFAQEIRTASAFFDQVSARYGEVEDYSARITITREETVSQGTIEYLLPNRIRIDFSEPEDQVLVSDGELLQVYIPEHNVVLQQPLRRRSDESLASLASEQGLNLMRRNYSIAYLDSPSPVPLDEGSDEMVTKLRLNWRNSNEGYRQLILSVNQDLMIRRIIGVTANYEEVQFDFEDIVINRDIPQSRFEFDSPPSANLFENFLFEGEG